jgi:putative ABC transport system permease protein
VTQTDNELLFTVVVAFLILMALLLAAVGGLGLATTMSINMLERVREIGVLRSTGMTRGQLWRLSLLETGLIGGSAGLLAMPTGFVLAVILIYIINLRSFGWTLAMRLEPWEFGQAFLVALAAALVAGLYPAWRMGQIAPAAALRSE